MSLFKDTIAEFLGLTPMSEDRLKVLLDEKVPTSKIDMCEEEKEYLRQLAKDQYSDANEREKHLKACWENDAFHVNKIWITKDKKTKRVTEEVYKLQYSDWKRGRYIPPETGFGTYDKRGANNPFYGKQHKKKVSK